MTREFNIDPNKTTFGGSCAAQLVTLELHSGNLLLVLQFAMVRAPRPASWILGPTRVCQQTPCAYPADGAGATRGLRCCPPPVLGAASLRPLLFMPAWEGLRVQLAKE